MNIALTTIVVFIILLPGLIYRKLYFSGVFSKQYFKQSFYELLLGIAVPTLILHILWIVSAKLFFNYSVNFELLGKLLLAQESSIDTFKNIEENLGAILWYFLTITLMGGVIGFFCKQIVRYYKIDRKIRLFRYENIWHYIFSGEFFDFKNNGIDLIENQVEDIDFVFIDALVETSEGTMIYDGILDDYELSKFDSLEFIKLSEVQRRYLKNDSTKNKDPYYNIPGHIFIIPFVKILNLNFTFYSLKESKKGTFKIKEVS